MSSHAGKTTFFIKNTSRIIPKMLPKTVQNTSKMEPKRVPKRSRTRSRKYAAPTWPKSPKRALKITSKRSMKSEKTVSGALFSPQKKINFLKLFFLSFYSLREARTLEIKPKRCKGVQKRGSHLFTKNLDFIQKCTKNDLPRDPRNLQKPQKIKKKTLPKTT